MKHILIISSLIDIVARVERLVALKKLPDHYYYYVIEYFNSEKPSTPQNVLAVKDFACSSDMITILEWVRKQSRFDTILSADEYAVYIAGLLRDDLQIPGLSAEASRRYRDKKVMVEAVDGIGARVPRTYEPARLPNDLNFPLVIKPRALAGAVGVQIVDSLPQLQQVLTKSELTAEYVDMSPNQFIVQEKIEAPLYHVDLIVRSSRCVWSVVSIYTNTPRDYLSGAPLISRITEGPELLSGWREFVMQIVQGMYLPDGVYHLEAFKTEGQDPIFLEIGYRPGGALVVPLLNGLFGVDLLAIHLGLQMGWPVNLPCLSTSKTGAWVIFPKDHLSGQTKRVTKVHWPHTPFESELIYSRVPLVGSLASGEFFCHEDSLGSFAFVGEQTQIDRDIRTLCLEYEVETTQEEVTTCSH